jgi:site-specific recombinase XerC
MEKMKVSEAISKFSYELTRRNLTTRNYVACICQAFSFAVEAKLTGETQRDRFVSLAKAWVTRLQWRKASAKTINLHIAAMRSFADLVLGVTIKNEEVPRLKEPKKLPEPFDQVEIQKIFAAENNRKHLLILQVTYYGGLRLSDVCCLRVRNLRFDRGLIHIECGKGKKDRIVPFPEILHQPMREHISGKCGEDLAFVSQQSGAQYPKRTIQKIFENACRRAGVIGRMNPHRFRHSFGSHMVQKGVNLRIIQEMMGHANSKTTEIYTRVAAQDIAAVRNVLVNQ